MSCVQRAAQQLGTVCLTIVLNWQWLGQPPAHLRGIAPGLWVQLLSQDKRPAETTRLLPETFQGRVNKDRQEITQRRPGERQDLTKNDQSTHGPAAAALGD